MYFVRFLYLSFCCFAFQPLIAQYSAVNWFMGNNAGLTFTNSVPTVTPNGVLTNSLGCSVVSGTAGNLLFYTDGVNVYNQSHTIMPNGTGLSGQGAFQPAIIVRMPANNSIYYIFTVGGIGSNFGLCYSIVDLSLAAGAGSVTTKNQLIWSGCKDKISAGRHCNQQDIWIVSYDYSNFQFISALLTSSGISSVVPSPTPTNPVRGTGQLKVSPNSKKIAINSSTVATSYFMEDARVFDFNPSTGVVNTTSVVNISYYTGTVMGISSLIKRFGCEFSPDSRFCYFTLYNTISKIDLCAPNPTVNYTSVYMQETANSEDTANKRSMQLAPDGKIYIALNGKTKVGTILNPNNTLGIASYTDMSLGTATCQQGIPNFPGFLFERKPAGTFAFSAITGSCLAGYFSVPSICSGSGYSVSTWQWDFGDIASGIANNSVLQNPYHVFSSAGTYSVTLIRNFYCNGSDTIVQTISVGQPSVNIIVSSNVCSVNSVTATVNGGSGQYNYQWSGSPLNSASVGYTISGVNTLTITDLGLSSCKVTSTFNTQVVNLSATVSQNSLNCNNVANGSATVLPSGGSGTYQYSWNIGPFVNNDNIANLNAGTYSVLVLDVVNQCSTIATYTILQPPPINFSLVSTPGASVCLGGTCFAQAYASGGSPPYSYFWQNGPNSAVAGFTNVSSGSFVYTCSVIDSQSCIATSTISLIFVQPPVLTAASPTVCIGDTALLQCSGAVTYTWLPGGIFTSTFAITPTQQITYTVVGLSSGCTSSMQVPVIVYTKPISTISSNAPICANNNLNLLASDASLSYIWSGPNQFISNSQNPVILNALLNASGVYTVVLTNSLQCSSTRTINIIVNTSPTVQIIGSANICAGQQTTLSATGPINYTWFPSGQVNTPIVISPIVPSTYSVVGSGSAGCTGSASVIINVQKCIGISENTDVFDEFFLYPNPTNGILHFSFVFEKFNLELSNSLGQIIIKESAFFDSSVLDFSNYPSGLYFIKIITAGQSKIFRIIKE